MTFYQQYLEQIKDNSLELDLLREQADFLNDLFVAYRKYKNDELKQDELIESINFLGKRIEAQKDTIHLLY